MGNDRGPLQMLINGEDMSFYEDSNEDREIHMYRSGSCPPTVERMNRYNNGFLNEDELRSDPNYSACYYSNASKNPRFPHPIMSKEDWSFNQSIKAVGSGVIGSSNDGINDSLGLIKEENEKVKWLDKERDGLIGLSIGRQKSFADIFQAELNHSNLYLHPPSRLLNSDAFDGTGFIDSNIHMGGKNQAIGTSQNGSTSHQSFASVLSSSLSRSNTPDPQLLARAPSPSLPPIGSNKKISYGSNNNVSNNGSGSFNTQSRRLSEQDSLVASLSGTSLSNTRSKDEDIIAQSMPQKEMEEHHSFLFGAQNGNLINFNSRRAARNPFSELERSQMVRQNLFGSPNGSPAHYQNFTNTNGAFTSSEMSGYPNKTSSPSMLPNYNIARGNYTEVMDPLLDPLYAQYLRSVEYIANNSSERGHANNSYDILETQKQYLDALLQSQKQYALPYLGRASGLNKEYYPNSACGLDMTFPGSPVLPVSPGRPGSPLRLSQHSMRFASSGVKNLAGGIMSMSNWQSDVSGALSGNFCSSHLEEFKTNKTKNYELSDIIGHVVEFSADQYGSRFIQQKLETATTKEKDMVYDEIAPHAFTLITDVFGNYVIQKFFEHGSATQRRELADQLIGHVLDLSLQMYGCRVIQKAIEVVDLDQQTKMVAELDGHIMRCVHDQNGNHVIQKCIECIPETAIQFIISTFYDQVLILSTHPYGCRVIQRTLEHCHDPKTQQIMMDEVFQHLCMLAQDQYGNYVVQHVIEHGKPHERSAIIKKLAGQIVQMSQQKFASNVVEKCLIFGGPAERQILVNEMLGTTDENEPLQAMMKDQFANYVVQKVLETCDDKQREFILSRIKVHLNALKKYTYGKHIVARVEKLVTAGERRIGMQSSYAT